MRYRQFFFVAWAHEWFCCVRDSDSPIRTTTEALTITHYYKQTEPKWSCTEFMLLSSSVHTHTTMMMMMIVDSFLWMVRWFIHWFLVLVYCVYTVCAQWIALSPSLSRTWSFFFFSVTLFVVVVTIVVAVCCFRTLQVQAKTMVRRVYERVCACVCVRTLRKTNERVYVVSIQPVDIYASVRLRVILLLCFVLVLICCERFFLLSIYHLCFVVFSTTIVVVSVAVLFSIKSASLQKRNKKPIYTRSK